MPDKYQDMFFRVMTPHGFVDVGWLLERKTRRSNITCLLCPGQGKLTVVETPRQLVRHIRQEHPQMFQFLRLVGWKQMIV